MPKMTFFWNPNFPPKVDFSEIFSPAWARAPEAKTLGAGPWALAHGPILGPLFPAIPHYFLLFPTISGYFPLFLSTIPTIPRYLPKSVDWEA